MRSPARAALAAAAAGVLLAAVARATVVERVVAVVGEHAILLSDLRDRARPFLLRIETQTADGAQRAAATSQLYGQLLNRLVEEELEQKAANRANVTVSPREIEDALARVAAQNQVTLERVVDEAVKSGLSEADYRQELRRQLLEAKLINLRIQGRLRVTDEDLRAAYERVVIDERRRQSFDAAWIRLPAPRALPPDELKQRRTAAERLVRAARTGQDFGALAARNSGDPATRTAGGRLGTLRPGQLPPAVDSVALALDAGGVSEPVRQGDDFVILKVLSREESRLPSFEEAREDLSQRVYMDKMGRARQHWLDGLKRQTHVEIRL